MPLNVAILQREFAIALARTTEARPNTDAIVLHIFCDASSKHMPRPSAGIGVVVNLWHPREMTKQRTTKACYIPFSRSDHNDLTEAFALAEGAYVAIDQILGLMSRNLIRSTDKFKVRFWSDSKVVLRALQDSRRFHVHHEQMQHVLHIIELKSRDLENLRSDVSVQFRWCPEECVEPHATADELSKRVRISGGNTPSKAVALFRRLPHSSIEAAIRRRLELPSPGHSMSQVSATTIACSTSTREAATQTVSPTSMTHATRTSVVSEGMGSQGINLDSPKSNLVQVPSAPETFLPMTTDPVTMQIAPEVASSSQFFGIITCVINSLPSHQRSGLHQVVCQQQDADKGMQSAGQDGQISAEKRVENMAAHLSSRHNRFALVEVAALGLPAPEKEMVLAAIELQNKANACRAKTEAQARFQESGSIEDDKAGNEPEVVQEPVDLEKTTDLHDPMNFDPSEILNQVMVIEEPKVSEETKVRDEPEVLDEHTMVDEHMDVDDYMGSDEPHMTQDKPFEEPEIVQEPELREAARPSRVRAVWNWVGRKLQRL